METGSPPLRLAIIGCGRVVEQCHLRALRSLSGLRVVALVDNDPRRSRMSATDAVVRLLTSRMRGSVPRRDAHGNEVVVDVMADPIKEDPARGIRANPAHAVIYANPHFVNPSHFKKLREHLSRIHEIVLLPGTE